MYINLSKKIVRRRTSRKSQEKPLKTTQKDFYSIRNRTYSTKTWIYQSSFHRFWCHFRFSTMKSFQVFIFLFVVIVSYETESVDGNVICTYNPCTFSPALCINGGTCKYDENCTPVCECPSDFSGYRCEISNRNNSCTEKCSPDRCNRKGYCTQDSFTCDFACDCFDGFAGDACNINVPKKDDDVNPCFPLICVHGRCDRSKPNKLSCICEDQWAGDTCNIRRQRQCFYFFGDQICT